ncbi:MAG TPA: YdbH domain-containing protein [Opitutaceae bacterium]|nr:YdbH domain-containing protein [Opitutaceae bacterium]
MLHSGRRWRPKDSGDFQVTLTGNRPEGLWQSANTTLDLAHWFQPLTRQAGLGERFSTYSAKGNLSLTGAGTFRDSVVQGKVAVSGDGLSLGSSSPEFTVEGIQLQAELQELTPLKSGDKQQLSFKRAQVAGIDLRDGVLLFTLLDSQRVRIDQLSVQVLGGTVRMGPTVLDFGGSSEQTVEAVAAMDNVSLTELEQLLPEIIAEAHGRVSGEIGIRWSPKSGLKLGKGSLRLDRIEAVEIRLTPQPGFLTSRAPERLTLLPKSWGFLSNWFSPKNPAHETLRQIEMGLMALEVEALSAEIFPDGDGEGRTARLTLLARPRQSTSVKEVTFDVNVSGPLDQVLQLGLQNNVSIKAGP